MRYGYAIALALLILFQAAHGAEIAVLPYRVENPSDQFPEETGSDYAKLLSVGALIMKRDVEVTSPGMLEIDLKRMKLDPQSLITGDDLDLLGRRMNIDYFLTGTLAKAKGRYRLESVLYSVSEKRAVTRIKAAASSLFKLAEEELGQALVLYRDRDAVKNRAAVDLAFIIDMSYAMNADWIAVKRSVAGVSSKLIDTLGVDSRIYLVPYSKKDGSIDVSVSLNSIPDLRKNLSNLRPFGGPSGESFDRALAYALKNISWRPDAGKMIVVIANSKFDGSRLAEQYGVRAKKMGITVSSLALGALRGDQATLIEGLAEITGGDHRSAAYHQKLYDKDGGPVELYMEKGRLFRALFHVGSWKDGILEMRKDRRYGKVRDGFDEIFIDDRKLTPDPYNLPDLYAKAAMTPVINKEKLNSNADQALEMIAGAAMKADKKAVALYGRALLADGKISFWAPLHDAESLKFFKGKKGSQFGFPVGVVVRKDPLETYGISFIPTVRGLTSDYIPEMMKATADDIIRKKEYYMGRGFLFPPVWFINVKVEELTTFGGKGDIRGD